MTLRRSGRLRRTAMTRRPKRRILLVEPEFTLEESRQVALERALWRCEAGIVCGGVELFGRHYSVHHRRPRQMGGTRRPETDSPANLLAVCGSGTTGCHGWIESNRTSAYDAGLLLHQAAEPTCEPVLRLGVAVYLTNDGGIVPVVETN